MPEQDEKQKTLPETANIADIAEAYLDLWQRSIGAWASDPRNAPPLAMIETVAQDWLIKNTRNKS